MSVLPKEVDYSKIEQLPANVKCSSMVAVPDGGRNGYTQGNQIIFSLNSYGYFVPSSGYLTAKISYTGTAEPQSLLGVVAQAWIERLDTYINSQSVESVSNAGAVSNMILNSKLSFADKWGLSKPFGTDVNSDKCNQVDSNTQTGAETKTVFISTPLNCIFQNATKMLPLRMGECRIALTVNSLANFSCKDDATLDASSLSNLSIDEVEYHYDIVEFDSMTDNLILGAQADENGDLYFKSESYMSSSAAMAAGLNGYTEIPFANSLASIKSMYALFCRTDRAKFFGAYDPTGKVGGSVQFSIANKPFPQKPLDSINSPGSIVLEHLHAVHGTKNDVANARCCLSVANFRKATVAVGAGDALDKTSDLSKAYFAVNTEKISGGSNYLLTGISSQNTNATVRVQINEGDTPNPAMNCLAIFNYDVLIKYNLNGQVQVLK